MPCHAANRCMSRQLFDDRPAKVTRLGFDSNTGKGKMTPGSLFEVLGHQRGGPDMAKSGLTLVRGSPEGPNIYAQAWCLSTIPKS